MNIKNLLKDYEDLEKVLATLEAQKKEIKGSLEAHLKDNNLKKLEESTDLNKYIINLVSKQTETLDKKRVKEILGDEKYQECLKITNSEFIQIKKSKLEG